MSSFSRDLFELKHDEFVSRYKTSNLSEFEFFQLRAQCVNSHSRFLGNFYQAGTGTLTNLNALCAGKIITAFRLTLRNGVVTEVDPPPNVSSGTFYFDIKQRNGLTLESNVYLSRSNPYDQAIDMWQYEFFNVEQEMSGFAFETDQGVPILVGEVYGYEPAALP